MDLILRNARVLGSEGAATDIGIDKGRIAAIRARPRRRRARPSTSAAGLSRPA